MSEPQKIINANSVNRGEDHKLVSITFEYVDGLHDTIEVKDTALTTIGGVLKTVEHSVDGSSPTRYSVIITWTEDVWPDA